MLCKINGSPVLYRTLKSGSVRVGVRGSGDVSLSLPLFDPEICPYLWICFDAAVVSILVLVLVLGLVLALALVVV